MSRGSNEVGDWLGKCVNNFAHAIFNCFVFNFGARPTHKTEMVTYLPRLKKGRQQSFVCYVSYDTMPSMTSPIRFPCSL